MLGPYRESGRVPVCEGDSEWPPNIPCLGLIFAARRVIRDVQSHLQNIANRYTVTFDSGPEDCFGVLGNSQEHIRFATGRFE